MKKSYADYKNCSTSELLSQAWDIQQKHWKGILEPCSIINAKSGMCNEDCKYCAQSLHYPTDVKRYDLLPPREIAKAARKAFDSGAKRFSIVTSGGALSEKEVSEITQTVELIRSETDIKVCGSLGTLTLHDLQKLKSAGMSRYHCNLETAPSFFKQIVTTHTIEDKLKTLSFAKESGMEICSGGILGLGETEEHRFELFAALADLEPDSIPINFLIPIKGTPLESLPPLKTNEILRSLALARILNPQTNIRLAAGRANYLKDFQNMVLYQLVNGFMMGDLLTTQNSSIETDQNRIKEILELWNG